MPRIICVGDPQQSLYRFRGADCHAFKRISTMLNNNGRVVSQKKLPRNYRCDQLIIQRGRKWVPELEGNSQAWGTVDICTFSEALQRANNDGRDIVLPDGIKGERRSLPLPGKNAVQFCFLCRTNKELVVTAYQLIAMGKKCCILGRDSFGEPLKKLIAQLTQIRCDGQNRIIEDTEHENYTNRLSDRRDGMGNVIEEGLLTRLANYRRTQVAKLQDSGYKNKLENLIQNCECLEVIATNIRNDSVVSVLEAINKLFNDTPATGVIVLSTIHRAKGGEWDVVFILRPDLLPFPTAKPNPDGSISDEQQQEYNACYVAATRPRHRLYYIENWPFGMTQYQNLNFDQEDIFAVSQYPDVDPSEYLIDQIETQYTKVSHKNIEDKEDTQKKDDDVVKFIDDGEPF